MYDIAWHQFIYLNAPVHVCVCVFAYEKLLLTLQLSVHMALHLHFITYLTNMPDNGANNCTPHMFLHLTEGGFIIAAYWCIIMNNHLWSGQAY